MKKIFSILSVIMVMVWVGTCFAVETAQSSNLKVVDLLPAKGVESPAKGQLTINTKNGTDITIQISGLDPKGLYTIFFVNVKSLMFEGIGPAPHVLTVSETGDVDLKTTMKKNIYKRFVDVGIYFNPGKKPIGNPLGVKAKLGSLIKKEKPKPILMGKLR